jgi:membrane protease YdiL (CAAX protease family)
MADMSLWFPIVGMAWTLIGAFVAYRKEWLRMPEKSPTFPFTARQFFFVVFAFFLFAGAFIFSSFLGHALVLALAQTPLTVSFGSRNEVLVAEQLVGLTFSALGVALIASFLPDDICQIITGKSGGIKKWAKGFFFGTLFFPLISLVSWLINAIMSIVAPQFEAMQVALVFLTNVRGSGITFWILIAYVVLVVPYIEEMIFRGALQGLFSGVLHPTLAVLSTSLCFSLFHYSPMQKGSNIEILIGLFVFSLFASSIRMKEDAVASSMGLHAGFNATSILFFLSQAS